MNQKRITKTEIWKKTKWIRAELRELESYIGKNEVPQGYIETETDCPMRLNVHLGDISYKLRQLRMSLQVANNQEVK